MNYEFEDLNDFITDDDLLSRKKGKKVNGKKKGNRKELELTKILNKRFGTGFSRTVGSGNRWSQTNHLPKHAQDMFTGDLITPVNFKFVLESKGGYEDIDLNAIFLHGNKELEEFLNQVSRDAKRCDKKPMLCWKKNRKPWLAAILSKDVPKEFEYELKYCKWSIIALEEILKLEDTFFF